MGVSERDLIGLLPPSSARKRGHPYSGVRFQVLFRWVSLEHGELKFVVGRTGGLAGLPVSGLETPCFLQVNQLLIGNAEIVDR